MSAKIYLVDGLVKTMTKKATLIRAETVFSISENSSKEELKKTVHIPKWVCDLAFKFELPHAQLTMLRRKMGRRDSPLTVSIEVDGWNEKFLVYSKENVFIVKYFYRATDIEEKIEVANLDGIVRLIRKHIEEQTEYALRNTFS